MLPIQSNLTVTNFNKRGTAPTYIVLHYTANNGDTAYNNTNYFKSDYRGASANYFVDETSIWECVAATDTAWHVGNDTYYNGARNTNAIGIEMCSYVLLGTSKENLKNFRIRKNTMLNAIDLVKHFMALYNIPIQNVCRHYDVTRKICPAPFVYNNDIMTWPEFLALCQQKGDTLTSKEYEELKAQIKDNHNAVLSTLADMRKEYAVTVYDYVSNCPAWARNEIEYLVNNGYVLGADKNKDRTKDGKLDVYVRFSFDMCRMAVMFYRMMEVA